MPLVACPHCHRYNVARAHRHALDRLLSVLFHLYPFTCDDCGHVFRARYIPPPPGYLD